MAQHTIAKKSSSKNKNNQNLVHAWWVRLVIAGLYAIASYAFISLAIDSGNLLAWFIGLFSVVYSLVCLTRAIRSLRGGNGLKGRAKTV